MNRAIWIRHAENFTYLSKEVFEVVFEKTRDIHLFSPLVAITCFGYARDSEMEVTESG